MDRHYELNLVFMYIFIKPAAIWNQGNEFIHISTSTSFAHYKMRVNKR